ncbi:hypothetical protein M1293_03690 [Candidatus Parvarchaeota archaeon]|nr:hypothetical protein [Candidatus Parvarchaeota archaeon]
MFTQALVSFANSTGNVTSTLTSPSPAASLLFSGVESLLFPFLLVFAISYGVLQKSSIFQGKSDINAIIAFVLGIIFATTNYTLKLTYLILPIVGIIAVVTFMFLALASMVYGDTSRLPMNVRKTIMVASLIVSVLIIIWILLTSNFTFAGISHQNVVNVLSTYFPYIVVILFLITIGYVLSK